MRFRVSRRNPDGSGSDLPASGKILPVRRPASRLKAEMNRKKFLSISMS
jgi:hypothetical protein